jgi:hypothetical protein
MALRPDAHTKPTDCLHHCIPGPIDTFLPHVYSILALLEEYVKADSPQPEAADDSESGPGPA